MILEILYTKNVPCEIKVYFLPSMEQKCCLSTKSLLFLMFIFLFSFESAGKVWLQAHWVQAVCGNHGNIQKMSQRTQRAPVWHQHQAWHHHPWCDGTVHTRRLKSWEWFPRFVVETETIRGQCRHQGLVRARENVAWPDTECVISTGPEVGNIPAAL